MSNDETKGQPQASFIPTDFNDLHVLLGIDEVKRQILHAVQTVPPLILDSPSPLDDTSQETGKMPVNGAKNGQASSQNEIPQGDDFKLDYAPPMNAKAGIMSDGWLDAGEQENIGDRDGNIITVDFKLIQHLKRYAMVSNGQTAFDKETGKEVRFSNLKKILGAVMYKQWEDHPNRETVEANLEVLAPNMFRDCVLLRGESLIYDHSLNKAITEKAAKMAYPREYKSWLESDQRKVIDYENLYVDPTGSIDNDPKYINAFRGYPVEQVRNAEQRIISSDDAAKGCENILIMINDLCNNDPEIVKYLLQWLAKPLQEQGFKLHSAVLMASHVQGSGKTTLFEKIMGRIYGKYHNTVGSKDLEGQFNGYLNNITFLYGEEVATNSTRFNVTPLLNQLVTAKQILINEKMMPARSVPAFFNMAFSSNENIPFPLRDEARRWFVIAPQKKMSEELGNAVNAEIDGDGVAYFYTYLMQLDMTGFQHDKPPTTDAKLALIGSSNRSTEEFIKEWLAGDTKYAVCCCTAEQLFSAYKQWATVALEHKYTRRMFIKDLHKIDGVEPREREHWKYLNKSGREMIIQIGTTPTGEQRAAFFGECIEKFDESMNGGVPQPIGYGT